MTTSSPANKSIVNRMAFFVKDLSPSQLSFNLITQVNKKSLESIHDDVIAYYENPGVPCMACGFMMTNAFDAASYTGHMISTNLSTAQKSLRFASTKTKWFYVYDLEWIKMPNKKYEALSNIYGNNSLRLIARSESHAKILEDVWNVKVHGVAHEFNIDQFIGIIKNAKT